MLCLSESKHRIRRKCPHREQQMYAAFQRTVLNLSLISAQAEAVGRTFLEELSDLVRTSAGGKKPLQIQNWKNSGKTSRTRG